MTRARSKAMRKLITLIAACSGLATAAQLQVSLDTSLLIGHPAGPFYVEFQFNDGVGTGDGNNSILVDNFDFGGGGPGLILSTTGGAAGSMDVGVNLTDTGFFNQFFQEFSPGVSLSFNVQFTTAVDLGPQPDEWTFAILDCSQTEIPTTSPANALVSLDISSPPVAHSYAGNPQGVLGCTNGPGIPIPTPRAAIVPEPATFPFAAGTLIWMAISAVISGRRRALRSSRRHREWRAPFRL
jgi:hypothetical protein